MKISRLLLVSLVLFFSQDINSQSLVLKNFPNGNEPSIVVNPNKKNEIVLAFNTSIVLKSKDTGNSFKKVKISSKYGFYGDPVLHWGIGNYYYLTHLAQKKNEKWPEIFDRIVFHNTKFSKNKNKKSAATQTNGKMHDKPWISVDKNQKSLYFKRIHLTWTQFDKYKSNNMYDSSRILYSFSDDNGKSFSLPKVISQKSGNCQDSDSTLEGATTCVDSFGNVYCVWSGLNFLWFTKSENGGISWTNPEIIGEHKNGWDLSSKTSGRCNGMPFIKCLQKNLILTWAEEYETDNYQVCYRFYNLKDKSWEAKNIVNSGQGDETLIGDIMPNIAVRNNKACLIYYQIKKNSEGKIEFYAATSIINENNKKSQINTTLIDSTPNYFNWFYGDYLGIDFIDNENVIFAYTVSENKKVTYIKVIKRKI